MQDETIIGLYFARNEQAIGETDRKYGRYLTKTAYNIVSDLEDSRECVNDTYLKAWDSIPPTRPSSLIAYLSKITRMTSIDLLRRKNRNKRKASEYSVSLDELGDTFSDGASVEETVDMSILGDRISRFLKGQSERKRAAFIGRYFFSDSTKKVAGDIGVSEQALKSMLFRMRKELKEYLISEGYDI
ncbi:MAG: RNA polymerase sigma factor [Clostridia bacterium]|nr:RNA polymerase sigma factor [Christensenellaceae bacterium]MBR6239262.1 RNA polymerase sigma factor [Clostridia bacterium]